MGCNWCSIEVNLTNILLLVAAFFLIKKLVKFVKQYQLEQMLERWNDTPKDKVILHTVKRGKTMPSISPFSLKLETYLRMAKIPYELETNDYKGPKGKLPWISYNGTHLGDTHLIIKYLNKKLDIDLNKNISQELLATARACRIVLEEHLFWGAARYRFVEHIQCTSQLIKLPILLKVLMPLRSAQVQKTLVSIGIGRHTPTEINQMTEDDLRTVSTLLGSKKFICGDEPCEDDAALFGFLAQVLWGLPGSSYEKLGEDELTNIKSYCETMKQLYWPDWVECTDRF